MRGFSVDYIERDGDRQGHLINRGFWLHQVPRPLILCRLFGHKPVVDGTTGHRDGDLGSRWVVCDRCGVRPDPQGSLDPNTWSIGDRYTGRWLRTVPHRYPDRGLFLNALKRAGGGHSPGPWPDRCTGTLGVQIVVGRRWPRLGFGLKVGNKGSEHTLAADFHLPWIGSLYMHTERFGRGIVRRLNPDGYHSKVIELVVDSGYLRWKLWADRDAGWCSNAPWTDRIRNGSLQVDPRTILLGPKRYSYTDHGAKVTETVRMPHGDYHEVQVQLQRRAYGRKRGHKKLSWKVEWEAAKGIPTKSPDRGRIYGSGVDVTDAAVAAGTWQIEAAVRIAEKLAETRAQHDWLPAVGVPR